MSWGNPYGKLEIIAANALSPISTLVALGSYCRSSAYSAGILKHERFSVPVVSVGNITCGGTGKTPMVIELGSKFINAGLKVGILSRGYKRRSTEMVHIVSDGAGKFPDCEQSGDEPTLIAKRLPEAIVLVAANRRAAAGVAALHYRCDVLLLDDGFQHLPVDREVDIVLLDYNDEPENDLVLPAGRLREPLTALSRASAVVITKVPVDYDLKKLERLENLVHHFAPGVPVHAARYLPLSLVSSSGVQMPIEKLRGLKVVSACALARPENFALMVKDLGATLVKSFSWPDHHWYRQGDLARLEKAARSADLVLTTEKDMVKMKPTLELADKLFAVRIGVDWLGAQPPMVDELINTVKTAKQAAGAGVRA